MATAAPPASVRSIPRLVDPWPLLVVATAALALAIGWVGYAASDDAAYYLAAIHWLDHAPQPGDDHWGTRFPLILSLVVSLSIFGKGAVAMAVAALGWYVALVASVRALARRIATPRSGWIAALLVATMPVVVADATTVSCDLTEAVFLLLGIRLLGDVSAGEGERWTAIAAGAAFGAAILSRETAALALVGLLPVFALGRPVPRRALVAAALGCAAVLAGEALYQWTLTGDALHRWTLAFHHDSHLDRAANEEGNILVHPAIDPLLVLLINDDFALLFWAAIAAVAFRFDRALAPGGRRRMLVLAMLGGSTFLLVGALTGKLVLNPRYFMLPAVAAAIAVGAWIDGLTPRARAAALMLLVDSNLLMLAVENQHPRWAAQALVMAASAHPGEPITTDPATLHRALMPLGWAGLARASAETGRPGAFWFGPADSAPTAAIVLARYPSPPTKLGAVLDRLGVGRVLPASVSRRLLAPNPAQVLAR